jgi:hypothetical protein
MLSLRLIEESSKIIISNDVCEQKSEERRRLEIVTCKVLLCQKSERRLDEEVQAPRFRSVVGLPSLQSIEAASPFSAHVNELRTGFRADIAAGSANPRGQIVML